MAYNEKYDGLGASKPVQKANDSPGLGTKELHENPITGERTVVERDGYGNFKRERAPEFGEWNKH